MKVLVVVLLAIPSALQGAFEPCAQGARSAGAGGTMVAAPNHAWAVFCNPAMIATLASRTVSLSYCPELFGLHEISRVSFSYVEPTPLGAFALSATRFGFSLYRELGITFSYGISLGSVICAGGSLSYDHLGIRKYGNDWTPVLDLGIGVGIGARLQWGLAVHNATGSAIGTSSEKLPEVLATGLSAQPLPGATVNADLIKDIRYPLEVHVGIEYELLDILFLRAGLATEPSSYSAGAGIQAGFVQLDYAFTSHPLLGFTQQISITFRPAEL